LYPELFRNPQLLATIPHVLHAQFAAHVVLLSAMIVATFIDFDEQTIPDAVTLPVTIAGLCFAALLPFSLLPIEHAGRLTHLFAPAPWPWPMEKLDRWPALLTALACYTGWVLAILPKTCTLRKGLWKGLVYMLVSMARRTPVPSVAVFLVICCAIIAAVWQVGGDHWKGLYTALIGMAAGGGLIWSVRLVGRSALKREAMGFGDVTLMAMIGTFVGWQSTLIIFFLAPVAALLIAVIQWLLTRNNELAFGPYLCLATVLLLLGWPAWWDHFGGLFLLGMLVPAILAGCLVLMWALLTLMRTAREVFAGPER
jgi:leader peptidase (prepilin peptidase) / N-methyltransferase